MAEDSPGERSYFIRGQRFVAPTTAPGLHLVATPIGNLGDITIRALDTLAGADLVACEDTRVTRKLLTRYDIRTPVTAYHEHSSEGAHARILAALQDGRSIALASDAGTPLISDPGFRLVRDAAAAGVSVTPLPGPSSVMAALAAAGLPTDTFVFAGFLPAKASGRRRRLEELGALPGTLVLLESPNRIGPALVEAAEILGAEREASLCREMTKLHETFDRATLGALAQRYADVATKGEIVLVIGPPGEAEAPAEADVDRLLTTALRTLGMKEAAQAVADETGLSRRELYQRALLLRGRKG